MVMPTMELTLENRAKNSDITATVRAGTKIFIPILLYWALVYSLVGAFTRPTFTFLKMAGMHITMTSAPETLGGSQLPRAVTTPKEHQKMAVPMREGFSLSSRFLMPA